MNNSDPEIAKIIVTVIISKLTEKFFDVLIEYIKKEKLLNETATKVK